MAKEAWEDQTSESPHVLAGPAASQNRCHAHLLLLLLAKASLEAPAGMVELNLPVCFCANASPQAMLIATVLLC